MSAALPPFPQVTDVLMDFISANVTGISAIGSRIKTDALPFVLVSRVGGPRERLQDYPTVDVEVFATTFAAASSLAERIDVKLSAYPLVVGNVVIDSVYCSTAQIEVPWDDSSIRRILSTYQLVLRR